MLKAIPDVCIDVLENDGLIAFEIARQLIDMGNWFLMCVSCNLYLLVSHSVPQGELLSFPSTVRINRL